MAWTILRLSSKTYLSNVYCNIQEFGSLAGESFDSRRKHEASLLVWLNCGMNNFSSFHSQHRFMASARCQPLGTQR